MTEIPLERDWKLHIIEFGEESPLENHAPMELAVGPQTESHIRP